MCRLTLRPSNLASVKVNYQKNAVETGQELKAPSADIFAKY